MGLGRLSYIFWGVQVGSQRFRSRRFQGLGLHGFGVYGFGAYAIGHRVVGVLCLRFCLGVGMG